MNYLLTASLLLLVIWPAYLLLLHYSSRYTFNRFVLLLAIVATFALPVLNVSSPLPEVSRTVQSSLQSVESSIYIYNPSMARPQVPSEGVKSQVGPVDNASMEAISTAAPTSVNYWLVTYLLGFGAVSSILLIRLSGLIKLHLRSKRAGGFWQLPAKTGTAQAFTFGRRIYLSPDLIASDDLDHILSHEEVHARQLHSVDILASELLLCAFWFHPVAWWLRAKLRANLEYLVDREVVDADTDRKRSYQLALVRQSQGTRNLALALPFSEPTLRSRIARITGMPEYRVATWFAGAGLLIWLAAAALVLKGQIFEQAESHEYLAASAGPDDPYVQLYNTLHPDELRTFELYTDRMLTGDEYLRVRALLAKAPGAKLYAYKNAKDQGPSLQLVRGYELPAEVTALPIDGSPEVYLLGLEKRASPTDATHYTLVATEFRERPTGGPGTIAAFLTATPFSNPSIAPDDVLDYDYSQGPLVYLNGERIDLRAGAISATHDPAGHYTVGGVDAREINNDEWTKLIVEGRPQRSPSERMAELLGHDIQSYGKDVRDLLRVEGSTYGLQYSLNGTYRTWYQDLNLPEDHPCDCRYNDRRVSKEFLLNQEFGPNAMIHVHHQLNKTGLITLQVLDDYPDVYRANAYDSNDFSGLDDRTHTLNVYLKRMPGTSEIEFIRQYLKEFPGYELRLYQSCTDHPGVDGTYTLHFGEEDEALSGYTGFELGVDFDVPRRLEVTRYGPSGMHSTVYAGGAIDWPAAAADEDVVLEVDGKVITVPSFPNTLYDPAKLDEPIYFESLRCKMHTDPYAAGLEALPPTDGPDAAQLKRTEAAFSEFWEDDVFAPLIGEDQSMTLTIEDLQFFVGQEWIYLYQHPGPHTAGFSKTLEANGYADRPINYFINEQSVTEFVFTSYQGGDGSYVQLGTFPRIKQSGVYMQIIDPE